MCPAFPSDAKGLLKSAIRDDNPSLFLEHKWIYRRIKEQVSEDPELLVPIGSADVKREGSDVSIITYGAMVHKALEAAEALARRGISAEVVDLRTVYPLRRRDDPALDREDVAGARPVRVLPVPRDRNGGRGDDRREGLRTPRRPGGAAGAARTCRSRSRRRSRTRSCRRWPTSRRPSTGWPPGEEDDVTSIQMPQLGETIVEGTILKWLKREGRRGRSRRAAVRDLDRQGRHRGAVAGGGHGDEDPGRRRRDRSGRDDRDGGRRGGARHGRRRLRWRGFLTRSGAAPGEAVAARRRTPPPQRVAARHRGAGGSGGPAARGGAPRRLRRWRPCPIADRARRSSRRSFADWRRNTTSTSRRSRGPGAAEGSRRADVMAVDLVGGQRRARDRGRDGAPATAPAQPMPAPSAGIGEEIVPVSHIRRAIAEHMLASTQTTARAWTMVEVNVDHLVKLRERVKATFQDRYGVKLTYLPMVVRATVDALLGVPGRQRTARRRQHRSSPVRQHGDRGQLRRGTHRAGDQGRRRDEHGRRRAGHRGPGGTRPVAPADGPTRSRARRSRSRTPGRTDRSRASRSSTSRTSASCRFDAIVKRPVVIDDAIAIRSMVNISMSWDHRVIDGELATRFLARVRENLETWDFAEDLGRLRAAHACPARLADPHRGTVPYDVANAAMHRVAERRLADEIPDMVILLEHPPVFTAGRRAKDDELLWSSGRGRQPRRARFGMIDRGGSVHVPRAGPARRVSDRRARVEAGRGRLPATARVRGDQASARTSGERARRRADVQTGCVGGRRQGLRDRRAAPAGTRHAARVRVELRDRPLVVRRDRRVRSPRPRRHVASRLCSVVASGVADVLRLDERQPGRGPRSRVRARARRDRDGVRPVADVV